MAYLLALSSLMSRVHDVFHVLMLQKYVIDPSHVLQQETVNILPKVKYKELLVQILDRNNKELRNKMILLINVF